MMRGKNIVRMDDEELSLVVDAIYQASARNRDEYDEVRQHRLERIGGRLSSMLEGSCRHKGNR